MLRTRPLTVVMDTTERCNLRCVMCYFSATDRLRFPPFDRELSENGNMPVEIFEQIAERYFPRAWRVSLGCAAEPLIHPKFADIVRIAGRYGIEDLWFPTNLLALTDAKAEAIVEAGVRTVGISMDGTTPELYETIRAGGKWELFQKRLTSIREASRGTGTGLRIIYTWMQSNKHDLRNLPAFAEEHEIRDLDVRFVTPTMGVDNTSELLEREDRAWLDEELARVAEDAVDRGIRLAYYPSFETEEDRDRSPLSRVKRFLWRVKAGLYRPEYFRYRWQKEREGCAYPKRTVVIRPNGAVSPCIFWDGDPLGFLPESGAEIGERLDEIVEGLACGEPIGTCTNCSVRRDAFYQPLRPAEVKLG